MSDQVVAARDRLLEAVAELRAITMSASGDELCSVLGAVESGQRSLDQVSVATLAAIDRQGVFAEHGYRSPSGALADLLRWDPRRSRRFVTAAGQVVERVGLDGETLPARLPATATVFASGEIGMRHVEVVAALLGSAAAERLPPQIWADAEQQLAAHAADYTPAELHAWGTQLIELLDEDGPEPDDRPEPQINEVHVVRHRNRPGGTIRGRFSDAEMFERVATAVDTHGRPRDADDARTPAERQAEGLAEICGYALSHGPSSVVPETGGRRPQVVVTIRLEDLERRARAGLLEFTGQTTPAALRLLACDATVLPVVLGGNGEPLDVGRGMRTVPEGLRRAVTARDRGCAHPGCDLPPSWCQIHHIVPWSEGGSTAIGNLVMLCAVHHRLVHHSGWEIRMADGRPEFVPPGWIDPWRRPRSQPDLARVAGLSGLVEHCDEPGPTVVDIDGAAQPYDDTGPPVIDVDGPARPPTIPFAEPDRDPGPPVIEIDGLLGPSTIRVADFSDLDWATADRAESLRT